MLLHGDDLLRELNEARKCVQPEEYSAFDSFFIGVLSHHCEPSEWRDALAFAKAAFVKSAEAPHGSGR